MNRKIISLTASILLICVIFTSCTFTAFEYGTTSSPDIITEENITLVPPANSNVTPLPSEEKTTDEITTDEKTEEPSSLPGTVIGYTSKGYAITQKGGITYVDGVLVANKTYSLPKNYNPGDLLPECKNAFNAMKSAAAKENLTLWNASGFRSYALQESLYTRYSNRDGKAAADRYSARPGHSEHQTGLAIDLNTITSAFADTAEGKWVAENCWKFGFILRYPKEKETETGYMYEAWHIRYVGTEVAEKIYKSGLCLEEFYGITSVYSDSQTIPEETTVPEPSTPESTETVTEIQETTSFAEQTTILTSVG